MVVSFCIKLYFQVYLILFPRTLYLYLQGNRHELKLFVHAVPIIVNTLEQKGQREETLLDLADKYKGLQFSAGCDGG